MVRQVVRTEQVDTRRPDVRDLLLSGIQHGIGVMRQVLAVC